MTLARTPIALSTGLWILLLSILVSKNPIFFLKVFLGKKDYPLKTQWASHKPLNNDRCWINTGIQDWSTAWQRYKLIPGTAGQACEDVTIHDSSSTAFLACGYPQDRLQFYPSAGRHNFSVEHKHLEYFIKYEIETNTTTRLEIKGWSGDEDLVLHGLDIRQPAGDASQIYIYAVNHARTGESILLFSHVLGTNSIRLIKKFSHSLIKTPNEVAAAGERSFFVSNDHYYYGGKLRDLEDSYGPFNWASNVVYCEEKKSGTDCRVVTPKKSHPWANGLAQYDYN